MSAQTIYSWRTHFGTLEPADVKCLRQLEQENGRLKKMVADRDLEIDVLKEITRQNMIGARVRRQPSVDGKNSTILQKLIEFPERSDDRTQTTWKSLKG